MQASRIRASPAHPVMTATRAGSRRHWSAVSATRAPAANCQALVGSEKYAARGITYVISSDSANDRTAISVTSTRYGLFDGGASVLARLRVRRISHAVPTIMGGHNR